METNHSKWHQTEVRENDSILYADDQIIIAESEDELQIILNEFNKTVKKYDMKISTTKTKTI
jgi:hypothetical protein